MRPGQGHKMHPLKEDLHSPCKNDCSLLAQSMTGINNDQCCLNVVLWLNICKHQWKPQMAEEFAARNSVL